MCAIMENDLMKYIDSFKKNLKWEWHYLIRNNDGSSPLNWEAILVCKRKNAGDMIYNDVASYIALTITIRYCT